MEEVLPVGLFSGKVKNIHLVGIGGVGMSSLALLLKEKGFNITGSDIFLGPRVKELINSGIKVNIGHSKENLGSDIHIVGYSSAVRPANPEIKEARDKGMAVLKRGRLLAELCNSAKTIAVAGSHGKTTTTSLIAYLLSSLGYNPAVFLGGTALNDFGPPAHSSSYFVVETDESDASFLYCKPWVSVITNIDKEHLEHYRSFKALKESFFKFAGQAKDKVIGWSGQPYLSEIISQAKGISFGFSSSSLVRAKNFSFKEGFSYFDLYIKEDFILSARSPLLGEHNCLNALAAFAFLYHIGADLKKAGLALEGFKGVGRRFQFKTKVEGVTFVDDYAHHPTEIKAVLASAKCLKPKRLFVVFQPHRYSRVQSLYKEFCGCFSSADKLVVTDIYGACEQGLEGVNSQKLCKDISSEFKGELEYIPKGKLSGLLPSCFEKGDLVLSLGAGDINTLMGAVADEFSKNRAAAKC